MKRVFSTDLATRKGTEVLLFGWVRRVRTVGADLAFIILADGAGSAQVVVSGELIAAIPPLESSISITGVVQESRSRDYGVEVLAHSITLLAPAEPLPFPLNHQNLEAGLDLVDRFRPLALRHHTMQTTFRLQHALTRHFEDFFSAQGFTRVTTPKILSTGTEGGAELFKVDYFGETAYLAQSPQFFKQMLVGSGFERVFEIGPVFRAEEHRTSRHLNEFISLDIEMGFVNDVHELMDLEEQFLNSLLAELTPRFGNALQITGPLRDIPRLSLAEALSIVERRHGKTSPDGNIDPEGERLISAWAEAEHGVPAVFLHSYPTRIRPFYAMPSENEPELTHSFDLIFRGQEITTGGLRIHNPAQLLKSMQARGLNPETYEFYLQVFRYGMPPHGGFAIGAERLTAQLLGLKNIREASIMPVM
jgi:nondiscriminating aspartyl-tRNA synthetase